MQPMPELDIIRQFFVAFCASHDWRLFSCADLGWTVDDAARQMAELIRAWQMSDGRPAPTEDMLKAAATHVYCRALHRALGLEGTAAQDCAFGDLWRYVTPTIRRFLHDLDRTAACANGVLVALWQQRDAVREPGALFAYATRTAWRAALRAATGDDAHYELSLDGADGEFDEARLEARLDALLGEAADHPQPLMAQDAMGPADVGSHLAAEERARAIEQAIRDCLRSRAQQEVFIALLVRGEPMQDVAQRLGITENNVNVLKHRAKTRLIACRPSLAALHDELAAPKEVPHVR